MKSEKLRSIFLLLLFICITSCQPKKQKTETLENSQSLSETLSEEEVFAELRLHLVDLQDRGVFSLYEAPLCTLEEEKAQTKESCEYLLEDDHEKFELVNKFKSLTLNPVNQNRQTAKDLQSSIEEVEAKSTKNSTKWSTTLVKMKKDVLGTEALLKEVQSTYKNLSKETFNPGQSFSILELKEKYGIVFGQEKDAFRKKVKWLEKNRESFEKSILSFERYFSYLGTKGDSYKDSIERLILMMKEAQTQNTGILKEYAEAAASVSQFLSIKLTQLSKLKERHPHLSEKIDSLMSQDYNDLPKLLDKESNKEIKNLLSENPLVLAARTVTDQGFVAIVRNSPTKTLDLKAKSDIYGNIPIKQVFSNKVSSFDEVMFDEFSFKALAQVKKDGLPTSISKKIRKTLFIDGEAIDAVRVLKKGSDSNQAEWVSEKDFDAKTESEKNLYHVYYVHADPRSMKGGTEELRKEWLSTLKKEVETSIPHYDIPMKSKNSSDETIWNQKLEKAKKLIEKDKALREENLSLAQKQVEAYAEFLVKKENPDATGNHLKQLVQEKIETSGSLAPDLDLMSIATKDLFSEFQNSAYREGLGDVTSSAESFLREAYKGQEAIGQQRIVHHGAEELNWDFPQDLVKDYPIIIYTSNGEMIKIPKGEDTNPHKNLFSKFKEMEKEYNVELSVNPAYVFNNLKEFEQFPVAEWPLGLKKSLALYRKHLEEKDDSALTMEELDVIYSKMKDFNESKIGQEVAKIEIPSSHSQ